MMNRCTDCWRIEKKVSIYSTVPRKYWKRPIKKATLSGFLFPAVDVFCRMSAELKIISKYAFLGKLTTYIYIWQNRVAYIIAQNSKIHHVLCTSRELIGAAFEMSITTTPFGKPLRKNHICLDFPSRKHFVILRRKDSAVSHEPN